MSDADVILVNEGPNRRDYIVQGRTIVSQQGAFVLVQYAHRKTLDMYVKFKDSKTHCCQCSADLQEDGFLDHLNVHDSRKRKRAANVKIPAIGIAAERFL